MASADDSAGSEHGVYQSTFTFLLQLRRAMYALNSSRILNDASKGRGHGHERGLFYSSGNKLIWFCSTLHTYFATLVLDPIEAQMRRELEATEDIDAILAAHADAMKRMMEQACLGVGSRPSERL